MLDEVYDTILESAADALFDEVSDDLMDYIKQSLLEHNPDDEISIDDILGLIEVSYWLENQPYYVIDVVNTGIYDSIDTESIYTEDCNNIIIEYGIANAIELWDGNVGFDTIPDESDLASQIMQEEYKPDFSDVCSRAYDNLLLNDDVLDIIELWRSGNLKSEDEEQSDFVCKRDSDGVVILQGDWYSEEEDDIYE